ncbi:MAG: tetratricopeptide repeat protein, partial [Bryobacteraceae bacterium]
DYALAWCGLADNSVTHAYHGLARAKDLRERARAAAERALALDSSLPEAHISMGLAQAVYRTSGADASFRRALELNPNHAEALYLRAMCVEATRGRLDEALEGLGRALALEPFSLPILSWKAHTHLLRREFAQAIELWRHALELDGSFVRAHFELGMGYFLTGQSEAGFEELRKADDLQPGLPRVISLQGYGHALLGRRTEAEQALDKLTRLSGDRYIDPVERAVIRIGLGDREEALGEMEAAFADETVWMMLARTHPLFDSLRGEARWERLLERL